MKNKLLEDFLEYVEYKANISFIDIDDIINSFLQTIKIGSSEINIIDEVYYRAKFGYSKYKTNTDRTDYDDIKWLQNFKEELLDASIYAEVLLKKINNKND